MAAKNQLVWIWNEIASLSLSLSLSLSVATLGATDSTQRCYLLQRQLQHCFNIVPLLNIEAAWRRGFNIEQRHIKSQTHTNTFTY